MPTNRPSPWRRRRPPAPLKLRGLRDQAGLTAAQVSEKTKISEGQITKDREGEHRPDPRNLPLPSADEIANTTWFKSTSSESSQGCVEVAHLDNWTLVRDSKNPGGPVHAYTPHEWQCFLYGALAGEFNRS